MRLTGKVVVVTGAASGMGLAMAKLFTSEGASVVAGDWNGDRLDAALAAISGDGGRIVGLQGNIAERDNAEALVDLAVSGFGRIDALVNNAGIMDHMQAVGTLTDEMWRRVLGVNLDGPMFATRRAVNLMLAQGGGSIVNIASTAALSGAAAGCAYTVSKHGLIGLTKNTAWQYAKRGIRCNAICPGGTATNIQETMPADQLDPVGAARAGEYAALIPHFLESIDIATLALFLVSDESRSINGAIIPADAGWTAA